MHARSAGSNQLISAPNPTPSTAAKGFPVWQANYMPFGYEDNPQIGPNNYKFGTYARDTEAPGLDYAQFRYYSSQLMRFMSVDPLAGNPTMPQSLNRYSYVMNDPADLFDPLGLKHSDTCVDTRRGSNRGNPVPCSQLRGPLLDAANFNWAMFLLASFNPLGPVLRNPDGGDDRAAGGWWSKWIPKVPVNFTVILPVVRIFGLAVTVTYLPQTKNLCVAPGIGASQGRKVSAGPLILGNLANAKAITDGASISVGAQATPFLGAQATGNFSGILGGPTVGIPGGSTTATYGVCY